MDFGDLIDDEEDSQPLRRNVRPRTRRIILDDGSDSENGLANADDAPEDSDQSQQDDDAGSEQPKRKRRKKGSLPKIHKKKYNLPFSKQQQEHPSATRQSTRGQKWLGSARSRKTRCSHGLRLPLDISNNVRCIPHKLDSVR